MDNKIVITGKTGNKGNVGYYNLNQLEDFARKNPDCNLVVTFEADRRKSKASLLRYYYSKIVHEWQVSFHENGEVMTNEQVDKYLRSLFAVTRQKTLSELDYFELVLFIDFLKYFSLEQINCFIESPYVL